MNEYKIILFLCNWGPHTALQSLQENYDAKKDIPMEIKIVRIPCTGRISKALLIKAFEMGADGVALVGCKSGTCRYGSGTITAEENTRDTRDILGLLGLKKDRMQHAAFLPDEGDAFLEFINNFCNKIRSLGKSPVVPAKISEPEQIKQKSINEIISAHDIYACQDCGKCTSACPLALIGKPFSPRAIANSVIKGDLESDAVINDVWACLTCGLCYERCPSAVNFPEFIKDVRYILKQDGTNCHETHGGFFHSMMRTMTSSDLKTERWSHLPDDIKINHNSKVLFFGGCAPFFDIFFRKFLGVNTNKILIDSLRLLNFFDIQPAILNDERCCGHDLLWSGDRDNFLKLAQLNADSINSLNVEEIITSCPECYRTLVHDYAEYGIELNCRITYLYEFLENRISKEAVKFKKVNRKMTYQDSCRLNRIEDLRDLPRKLIKRFKLAGFEELQNHGNTSTCCGNCAWIGCDSYSKALQVKRLRQARDTGSDVMLTSCPKCQIHLSCAMEDPFLGDELKIKLVDITSVIARTIYRE
ncbi:MAG: hydrogenase iron-sulfur subunit [Desulfosarcina sp.]|nr:hydrogenase iron-sulfur subunit [Desulfobacterales bacterium]